MSPAPESQSGIDIPPENNEALWPTTCHRDRSTGVLRRCYEGHRQRRSPGNRALAQQPGREFSPAVSKKRASNVVFPTNANLAKIRLRPRLSSQSFQPPTPPLLTRQFQAQPHRRSGRVAPTWWELMKSFVGPAETDSLSSDSTGMKARRRRILGCLPSRTCVQLSWSMGTATRYYRGTARRRILQKGRFQSVQSQLPYVHPVCPSR
jgi:hypothetical protein